LKAKTLFSTMPKSPWKKLEQFVFAFALLFFMSKVGGKNKCFWFQPCQGSKHGTWNFKAWLKQFFCTPPITFHARRLNIKTIAPTLCMEIWALFKANVLFSISYSWCRK
jgi:hypothetical protein